MDRHGMMLHLHYCYRNSGVLTNEALSFLSWYNDVMWGSNKDRDVNFLSSWLFHYEKKMPEKLDEWFVKWKLERE